MSTIQISIHSLSVPHQRHISFSLNTKLMPKGRSTQISIHSPSMPHKGHISFSLNTKLMPKGRNTQISIHSPSIPPHRHLIQSPPFDLKKTVFFFFKHFSFRYGRYPDGEADADWGCRRGAYHGCRSTFPGGTLAEPLLRRALASIFITCIQK